MSEGSVRGKRMIGKDRERSTREAVKAYKAGKSIREIADVSGRSYGYVHRVLSESGVALRGRGGATRGKAASNGKASTPRKSVKATTSK